MAKNSLYDKILSQKQNLSTNLTPYSICGLKKHGIDRDVSKDGAGSLEVVRLNGPCQ